MTREEIERKIQLAIDHAQKSFGLQEVWDLLGGSAFLVHPRSGLTTNTMSTGEVVTGLEARGWRVVMWRGQALQILRTGTAYDLLAEMERRTAELAAPVPA